MPPGYRAA